ncbi:Methylene-tetrahydrofolate reductase C terminal [Candidatus Methanoperedens nitroreducens]|uniref:Methylene-tetrahydrofolate reductase C terminal n=1 Tax=Candidatus Methanoperedens nitratireducens TaxID=1392998 RepID=A0A062UYI1_9EURY|nr:methylenetetrahydrofolate reductase C-terminal domain-containing protein [Candidatus Methanoperedens nitroreducens]KCZ71976.1 Methylene-tetrahydrofolate reductase C terminal [Candidatus Methanoperedens nitroreducens]MDJ1422047.1 methylenetetrahydrofolate reductase C-terminal domain-containing protein [Candidatus Methanoperedens sp.]
MIISRQKEFKDILRVLKEQNIFIIGCGKCATRTHVGGEPEVLDMKKRLAAARKNIVGWTVLSSVCSTSWDEVLSFNPGIKKADALLVMSCGGGASVISMLSGIQVYPALDTESLGGVCRDEIMKEQCGMCGECTIWEYGGICPLVQCAKGLLNGPCGGAADGKCEVDDRPCAWDGIYEKLKKMGKLEYLEILHEPKDHSKKQRRKN